MRSLQFAVGSLQLLPTDGWQLQLGIDSRITIHFYDGQNSNR
jgi:hypothetical protein